MNGVLRITPNLRFGSKRSLRIWERNVFFYRRRWIVLLSGFFEPLFYLLSIGIGLNGLVGHLYVGHVFVSYAYFVAPGMMATSAMTGAFYDAITNMFFRLKISHTYDAILATPIDVHDIALGEVLWAVTRATMYSASFLGCMYLLGDTHGLSALVCLPAAILTSFAFGCVGIAACTFLRHWQDLDMVSIVQMPIFLFSGTFFPVTLYPSWFRDVVMFSPLYHAAALLRDASFGQYSTSDLLHVAFLLAMTAIGLTIAARRLGRLLTP